MNSKLAVFGAVVAIYAFACGANGADVDCSIPPPMMDPRICCPVPVLTDEIEEKCAEFDEPPGRMPHEMNGDDNASNRPRPPARPHPHPHSRPHPSRHLHINPCLAQCILNETDILKEDDKINEANLKKYLAEALQNDTILIPIVEQSLKTCTVKLAELNVKLAQQMPNKGGASPPPPPLPPSDRMFRHRCRPYYAMLLSCAVMMSFSNCPDSVWADTEVCNKNRAFFNACNKL